jgi:type 2 lantibiotic biosynthesis protein LanM
LSDVLAEALYERFSNVRKAAAKRAGASRRPAADSTVYYDQFALEMKADGFRRLFEDKPVLLRLISNVTRQWIDTMREFAVRLDADLPTIRRDIFNNQANCRVVGIERDLSDPHNGGHSVLIVQFEDDSRVVYKPKDLRLDVAWHALVKRLNLSGTPIDLKTPSSIARDGYGWTEFINHFGCLDDTGCKKFFRRSGAWLALFHCFASSDMHEENIIAAGDYPVPIDIEVILQAAADEHKSGDSEAQAFEAAMEIIDSSVVMIGMLPTYRRSPNNEIFAMGGMVSDWNSNIDLWWDDINTDSMRPKKRERTSTSIPNLPHVGGNYRKFSDYIEEFVSGFKDYANFLLSLSKVKGKGEMFEGFAGLPVRKIIRPTGFYYLLMRRLKNHRTMDDGVVWSAQADFLARLTDWERGSDPLWPLQRAERGALLALNIPHFTISSDGNEICDANGIAVPSAAMPGLYRARARLQHFDEAEIAWQTEVIRQNTISVSKSVSSTSFAENGGRILRNDTPMFPSVEAFLTEADKIAADLARYAIRRGSAAAWIGFDWLGESKVAQLAPLNADLYNGVSGIALFFAAHCAVTGSQTSRELALAAVAHVRKNLNSRNAARMGRFLGIGGATGLGSIIYAFSVMSKCLRDDSLLKDAQVAARLFSDDLIGADKQLDVFGGSAGGILGLLRLHRDSPSADVLKRAAKCGEHLLAQPRREGNGGSWLGQGHGEKALVGDSDRARRIWCRGIKMYRIRKHKLRLATQQLARPPR